MNENPPSPNKDEGVIRPTPKEQQAELDALSAGVAPASSEVTGIDESDKLRLLNLSTQEKKDISASMARDIANAQGNISKVPKKPDQPDYGAESPKGEARPAEPRMPEKMGLMSLLSNGEVYKRLLGGVGRVFGSYTGLQSIMDVPRWAYQRVRVRGNSLLETVSGGRIGGGLSGSVEDATALSQKAQETGERKKFGDLSDEEKSALLAGEGVSRTVRDALKDINDRLKLTKEGQKQYDKEGKVIQSEQRKRLAQLLWQSRYGGKDITLNKGTEGQERVLSKDALMKNILDDYTETKITGMAAARETLNSALLYSGAFAARPLAYAALDAGARYARLKKESRIAAEQGKFRNVDILKDVVWGGTAETFAELIGKGESQKNAGTLQKTFTAGAALGRIARYLGITLSAAGGSGKGLAEQDWKNITETFGTGKALFSTENTSVGEKMGEVYEKILAPRFWENIERTKSGAAKLWSLGRTDETLKILETRLGHTPSVADLQRIGAKSGEVTAMAVEGLKQAQTSTAPTSPQSILSDRFPSAPHIDRALGEAQWPRSQDVETNSNVVTETVQPEGKKIEAVFPTERKNPIEVKFPRESGETVQSMSAQEINVTHAVAGREPPAETQPAPRVFTDFINSEEVRGSDSIWKSARTIFENPKNAAELGFKGDISNIEELHKWAETQTANMWAEYEKLHGGEGRDLVHKDDYVKITIGPDGKPHLGVEYTSGKMPGVLGEADSLRASPTSQGNSGEVLREGVQWRHTPYFDKIFNNGDLEKYRTNAPTAWAHMREDLGLQKSRLSLFEEYLRSDHGKRLQDVSVADFLNGKSNYHLVLPLKGKGGPGADELEDIVRKIVAAQEQGPLDMKLLYDKNTTIGDLFVGTNHLLGAPNSSWEEAMNQLSAEPVPQENWAAPQKSVAQEMLERGGRTGEIEPNQDALANVENLILHFKEASGVRYFQEAKEWDVLKNMKITELVYGKDPLPVGYNPELKNIFREIILETEKMGYPELAIGDNMDTRLADYLKRTDELLAKSFPETAPLKQP